MLTLDQQLIAREAGWKIVSGYVARAYNARGQCPFDNTYDVVRFLRQKGKTSDWHRGIYMNLPWSFADDEMSFEEGWRLAHNEILLRSATKFATNEDAQAYVQAGIDAGDPLHLKAIKTLAKRRLLYGDQ